MQVAVEHLSGRRFQAGDAAELDVLLQRDLEVVEVGTARRRGLLSFGGHELGQRLGLSLELLAPGDEVGLALQLDQGTDLSVEGQGDDALRVLSVAALGAGRQTLLAEPLLGGFEVAAIGLEGALGIHHPGAGRLAQRLDILGGE